MDPYDEASSPNGETEHGEKFESAKVNPEAPIESQRLVIRGKIWLGILAVIVFCISLLAAFCILYIQHDDGVYAWQFKGTTFRGGLAGLVVVAGVILAWLIVRQPVEHQRR